MHIAKYITMIMRKRRGRKTKRRGKKALRKEEVDGGRGDQAEEEEQ